MKVAAATTLIFASLALASPAPAAQPNAAAVVRPLEVEPRAPEPVLLEARKKPKGGSSTAPTPQEPQTRSRPVAHFKLVRWV
jgi:hypothetical protein